VFWLLARSGAGKTLRCRIALLAAESAARSAGENLVLLSTERQIVDFRRR